MAGHESSTKQYILPLTSNPAPEYSTGVPALEPAVGVQVVCWHSQVVGTAEVGGQMVRMDGPQYRMDGWMHSQYKRMDTPTVTTGNMHTVRHSNSTYKWGCQRADS